jgi:serine protease Do
LELPMPYHRFMAPTVPPSPTASPAPAPLPAASDAVDTVRWLLFAAATSVPAVILAGAAGASLTGGDVRAAAAVGLLGAVVVPLSLAVVSMRGQPRAAPRTLRSLAGLQAVSLAGAMFFAGAPTARALAIHGSWPVALVGGDVDVANDLMATVAAMIHAPEQTTTATATATTTAVAARPTTPKEVYAARAGSVVVVQVRQPAPPELSGLLGLKEVEGHGSGFVVDGNLVVTNHHVAGDAASIRIRLKDGRTFDKVKVLVSDPQNDLCVLAVDGDLGVPAMPLAAAEPVVGDALVVIGSPLGLDHTLTTGLVSAVRDQNSTHMLQMDAVVAPGSSGGPVFSGSGDVVGVATAMQGQGLNFAVGVSHVRAALTAPRTERVLAAWVPGFEFKGLETTGGTLLPTSRSNLLRVLPQVVELVEGCLEGRPAGIVTAAVSVTSGIEVAAASAAVKNCLNERGGMFRMMPQALLKDTGVTKATARYESSDGRITVLELLPTT